MRFDFVLKSPDYLKEISVHRIEDIHSLLTKDLGVERNIRCRRVGITGTNYRPLDNEFQIREALEDSCKLINGKDNIFREVITCTGSPFLIFRHFRMETNVLPVSQAMPY